MDLREFLIWLMTATGSIGIVSIITEQFESWGSLPSKVKYWASLAGSVVLGLGAWAVLTFVSPAVLEALKEPFMVVSGIVVAYFGGQVFHKVTKTS